MCSFQRLLILSQHRQCEPKTGHAADQVVEKVSSDHTVVEKESAKIEARGVCKLGGGGLLDDVVIVSCEECWAKGVTLLYPSLA